MQSRHGDERRARSLVGGARRRLSTLAVAASVAALGAGALAGPALAHSPAAGPSYAFKTLDNDRDLGFNQLLGINNEGIIAGYFGSGAQGQPNKGYLLSPRYRQHDYLNENFPGSVQTQVTGLNDNGITVGFWSDQNTSSQMNDNYGFYAKDGRFHEVNFPTSDNATPPVNQLLGVNDSDVAVGFYNDAAGNSHGYTYDIRSHTFTEVDVPGAMSTTTAAINNRGDLAGFETDANGNVDGFLMRRDGTVTTLDYPGAVMTSALGVNDSDEVVGVYQNADMSMHGFTWTPNGGYQTVDDPDGVGTTTINGVNDRGQLVGFYTVDNGAVTDGFLASLQPLRHHH